ncbi:hypothetical protein [Solitalea koreensis]|uniref:Uncharacterized protein n=1 Tax=Solitalea koreensis TaxID=543615 RepID=A0A521EBP0_9SPHI|nr:hypothetical protein [Solitalea koreensis]SMO81346.1 hypothetical protein SAMN06265350_11317 [Solitalea koreensis]
MHSTSNFSEPVGSNIRIRVFKAPNDPDTCVRFVEGHQRLLEIHYGIAKVTSGGAEWTTHENTIVIVAENLEGTKVYGGARVQLADARVPLPIETAIGKYDSSIHTMANKGSAEICGLWNSREVAGLGIGSIFMARVGIAICDQLPVDKVFFLCAPVTVRIGKRIGGEVETALGDNGIFYYPKDDFVATSMIIRDPLTLNKAEPVEHERIMSLRQNPIQQKNESGPKGSLEVDYQLEINLR